MNHEGFLRCQRLAESAAREIASLIQEGWTEKHAADLLDTALRDHGVRDYFHHPFVWFGERSRFEGIRNYGDFAPTPRRILAGEVFILDVAPIFDGHVCDIGYTSSLGENARLNQAQAFLRELRVEIPKLFDQGMKGREIWTRVDEQIRDRGYDTIHKRYPFEVLGHRIHHARHGLSWVKLFNFGWQSYWSFLSRGIFKDLLDKRQKGDLDGLWAVEPHIGTPVFGAKFEEILVVEKGKAQWLERDRA